MYGLLLESVRFHIRQKYGEEMWNKICKHCGLLTSMFTTNNSYSDTIMPKLSEACAQFLPCRLPADSYMEYFGNCFVEFTSALGYSNVLKVYSRSFRDFLDSIDSLHEHLRFEYPRLQSPSFECTEESASGLTLHYRSKRYGYKNYVIGQVKEIAKLYFNIEIEVIVLDEADVLTSFGIRRCHITYRVIFDNNSFTPLVKEHRYLSSMSVPIDLIFKISPFSFLINRDLQIFRASNDLNQYFGENMAGKKMLRVFSLRRPPIELTWESLINHGRVIFELVARQAGNISLFTDSSNTDLSELSARNSEWVERLQKIDKTGSSNLKPKQRSNSATLIASKGLSSSTPLITKFNDFTTDIDKMQNNSPTSALQQPSRGIIMIRRRSCSLQIRDMISKENNVTVTHGWNEDNYDMIPGVRSTESGDSKPSRVDKVCPASASKRENAGPKPIYWEDTVIDSKERNLTYEGILRPEPIGKHNDTSPSISLRRIHHSTSCPNIDVHATGAWNSLSGLHRPEPIGQEDARVPDVRAKVVVPSSSCPSTEADGVHRLERHKNKSREGEKSRNENKTVSRQRKNRWLKPKYFSCSVRFFRRKVTDMPADAEQEFHLGGDLLNSTTENRSKRSLACTSTEGNDSYGDELRNEKAATVFSSGFLGTIRRNINRVRNFCPPIITSRTSKITSLEEPSREQYTQTCSVSNELELGAQPKPVLACYSEPLVRKLVQKESINENMVINGRAMSAQNPQRYTHGRNQKSKEESQLGEKRKKVEMWLQRQQRKPLLLRGQIKHITHWNMVLFIGTPIIGTVEDLESSGLYLSDLNMHDGSRFLTMQGTQRLSEIEFACDREKLKRDLLKETTFKLEEERRRTEEILYSMMPKEIAERMKNGDRELTTCETFDDVTILFGYVADFTEICNKVEAIEVVKLVREVFSLFDILSENHKVYKFETIGGGVYMLVSGVPVKIEEHAREMSLMALSMLEKIQTVVNPFTNRPLELQIGIHSGPVVAGVIGQASLQYCLFGHTVNIASRMQTTGDKMKIHLSEATNRELSGTCFITEYRGSVPVKGVGNLDTYWLKGKDTSFLNIAGKV